MNLNKYIMSAVITTVFNGFIAIQFMEKNSTILKLHYNDLLNYLSVENRELEKQLKSFYEYGIQVDVTMYHPIYPQTDRTPDITADGTKFDMKQASRYKYVALSRNLLKRWGGPFDYGDFILLKGTDYKDGVYQVKDTMSAKWVNIVDILESKHVKPYKFTNANIIKFPWINTRIQ